jgi:hypothetical protein
VGELIEEIHSYNGEVVGVYYQDAAGTPMTAEATAAKMDSLGWNGEGYRISDQSGELWAAHSLWPGAPGVFVVSTATMEVVASEAGGIPVNVVQWAQTLDN